MVVVRQADPRDAAAIARIHVETWRATYAGLLPERMLAGMREQRHLANWSSQLGGRRSSELVLVAERTGQSVIGFVSAGVSRLGLAGYDSEIYTLYVSPDWQNQGVGTRLMEAAFERLRARKLGGVMLWVLARNPSRFFYEALGGVAIATRDERHWGVVLAETAYGWPDLTRALNRSSDGARA